MKKLSKAMQDLKDYEEYRKINKNNELVFPEDGSEEPDENVFAKYSQQYCANNKMVSNESGSFVFKDKYYIPLSQDRFNADLALSNRKISPQVWGNYWKFAKADSVNAMAKVANSHGMINLNNGFLYVKHDAMCTHNLNITHKFFFRYCLEHDYNTTAICPKWDQFLIETFDGDEELIRLAAQIFGYTLIGGFPWLQKAFVLIGGGSNGKSVFLEILASLVGNKNKSSVSMSDLKKPFSVVSMDGKLANIVDESPKSMIDSESFKTAVGGGTLRAAKKFQDEYDMPCHARLFFACNELPSFGDNSHGIMRRLVIIPFNHLVDKSNINVGIVNDLKTEMPGILNFALKGLQDLNNQPKRLLIQPSAIEEKLEEFRRNSDSAYDWILDNIEVTNDEKEFCTYASLYENYSRETRNDGQPAYAKKNFTKRLREHLAKKLPGQEIIGKRNNQKGVKFVRNISPTHGLTF